MTQLPPRRVASVGAMLLLVAGCTDRPRVPWSAAEILRAVEPELRRSDGLDDSLAEAEILMWQVREDRSRRLVVEEALLWARAAGTHPQPGSYALVHVYRHPADDNTWHRSVTFVERAPESSWPHTVVGYKRFDTPPGAPAVCEFIRHVRGAALDRDFSHVSGGFPANSWLKLTGQTPPCTFSGVVEGESGGFLKRGGSPVNQRLQPTAAGAIMSRRG
jgi:hypothetical protein